MTENRPDPLTPAECNLRGLEWMPLDVVTLPDSDLWLMSSGDEAKAAVTLWCKSWRQVPAASLPSDEKALANLSGAKRWRTVRDMAMRGWVLCSDNRYYHPVIAAKALEAWPARQEFEHKKTSEADRKARERADRKSLFARLRDHGFVPSYDTKTSQLRELVKQLSPLGEGQNLQQQAQRPGGNVTLESVTSHVTGHAPVTARRGTREGQESLNTNTNPPSGGAGGGEKAGADARQGQSPAAPPPPAAAPTPPAPPPPAPAPVIPPAPAAPRGLRKCPATFKVTGDLVTWANKEAPLLDIAALKRETAMFRDHTFNRAIVDWAATWRNWIRKAQKDAEKHVGRAGNGETAYQRSQRIRVAEATGGLLASDDTIRFQPQEGNVDDAHRLT